MTINKKSSLAIKKRTLNILSIVPRGLDGKGGIETFSNQLKFRVDEKWLNSVEIKFLCTRGTEGIFFWPILFIPRLLNIIFYLFFKKIDVIHLNVSWGVSNYRKVLIALIANIAKVPIIAHSHAGGLDKVIHKNFFWLKCFGFILKKSSKVVVLGNIWVDVLSKRFNIPKNKFSVIRNGIYDNNPQGIISANNIFDNKISICFIGMLGHLKGTAVLLEALRQLKADNVNFNCIFAGNGDINKFRKLSKNYGIQEQVEFLGWVESTQINNILKNSNIFVLPSGYENLPMSIIEAMSYGCAIVTTTVGVIPEILKNDTNAKLVNQSPQEIYEAVRILSQNSDLRNKLGLNARIFYTKNLKPEKTLDKLIELLINPKKF